MHGKAQGCAKWLQCDFLSYRNTSHKAGSHLSEARKLGELFPSRKLREGGGQDGQLHAQELSTLASRQVGWL